MIQLWMKYCLLVTFLFSFLGCSDDNPEDKPVDVGEKFLRLADSSMSTIEFAHTAGKQKVFYETDIEETIYTSITAVVEGTAGSWCKATLNKTEKSLTIDVAGNKAEEERRANVLIKSGSISLPLTVIQQEYIPAQIEPQYTKIKIIDGWAPDHLSESNTIDKSYDGDPATFFNAKSGEANFPYEIKFTLDQPRDLASFIYYPRQDSGNRWGAWGEVEVWYTTTGNSSFQFAGKYDFGKSTTNPKTITFNEPIPEPRVILFKVLSGYQNRVSIGEIEFYETNRHRFDYMTLFRDKACSVLKENITMDQIEAIPDPFFKNIAKKIFTGSYESEYRIQKYRPYQHPSHASRELKTARYSLRDNASGIYYRDLQENLIVFVDELKGREVSLNIVDYDESANEGVTYSLSEGLNIINPTKKGLIYIFYHVDEPLPLNPGSGTEQKAIDEQSVKIHIATGLVNGYFDIRRHTAADWLSIRDNAISNEIDILGLHSHVVWNVNDYRDYKTDIVLMTNYIDNIVKQQHEFMGLYHYNRLFKNRQFIRIDYSVPAAYATDYRTVYRNTLYKEVFCSEDGFKRRLWVLGHEIGHTNQTRPGMKWHGTTEVTNNIYALYNQEQTLGAARRLLKGESKEGYASEDEYDNGYRKIIATNKDWYLGGENFGSNYFIRLVPFWQLYLYLVHIEKQEHFYHDLYEHYRNTNGLSTPGEQHLDFVRNACNISKINLLGFFEKWGFLTPIDLQINDYGTANIKITQEQINNLKNEITSKGYKTPPFDITQLTDTNFKQYK